MTIKEFIEYLETLPETTELCVLQEEDHGYMGACAVWVPLEIDVTTDFTDMRGNPFAKGKSYENNVTLYLGDK